MMGTLARKGMAKAAWDAVKMMRIRVDCFREATAQRLRKELDLISFHDDETLDAFGMRLMTLVNNLRELGDTVEEVSIVQRFLRVVPGCYS